MILKIKVWSLWWVKTDREYAIVELAFFSLHACVCCIGNVIIHPNPPANRELRKRKMEDKQILLDNIDKIHTTEMGIDRIKRNLKIDTTDVVGYCKNKVLNKNCKIY